MPRWNYAASVGTFCAPLEWLRWQRTRSAGQRMPRLRPRHVSFVEGWQQAGTVRRAAELNQHPVVLLETYHDQGTLPPRASFISVEPANIGSLGVAVILDISGHAPCDFAAK